MDISREQFGSLVVSHILSILFFFLVASLLQNFHHLLFAEFSFLVRFVLREENHSTDQFCSLLSDISARLCVSENSPVMHSDKSSR